MSTSAPVFEPSNLKLWDIPKVFWRMATFCQDNELFALLSVNQRFHTLSAHDHVWKEILHRYNLHALLSFPLRKSLRSYFLEDVLTTRALHGRYDFEAQLSSAATFDRHSPYNITSAVLIVSTAALGNQLHAMGRCQLMISYRSGSVEVLQGCLRFSGVRKCFIFCSSVFGAPIRGPVFTVTIALAKRKWANQSAASLQAHQGGLRLVMTPFLAEGKCKGSLITETDIVAVSRPPPDAVAQSAALAARASAVGL
jgi:hypothetical protein